MTVKKNKTTVNVRCVCIIPACLHACMCMRVVAGGLGVGRFRILGRQDLDTGGSKGGRIPSRHMTS